MNKIADDNNILQPIYRYPIDPHQYPSIESNMNEIIKELLFFCRNRYQCKFNHALIQYYPNSKSSYINEHSDKTLDIDQNSIIINISIGASRTMILKSKKIYQQNIQQSAQHIYYKTKLIHGSCYTLSLAENQQFLHAIKCDKRIINLKDNDELYNYGERISITFRKIITYHNPLTGYLYKEINNQIDTNHAYESSVQAKDKNLMYQAFSLENKESNLVYDQIYHEKLYHYNPFYTTNS